MHGKPRGLREPCWAGPRTRTRAQAAWPDLLTRKHTERHADDSFHNYVYRAFAGEIPRNEYLRVRWHRIGDMIGTRLFGETMDHSADHSPRRRPRRRRRRR
jgi:hypothetical protein